MLSEDFGSNVISLTCDGKGALTDGGVYALVFNACNRGV